MAGRADMIYLDNAATTFPKPKCVYRHLKHCLRHAGGNPGRSSHRAALLAAEEIYEARETLCTLLAFPFPERIVFTQNATYALNMAIRSLIPRPRHIIFSDMEHNSVIRPIAALAKEGCTHSEFSTRADILEAMEGATEEKTDLCVLTLCSNVTGECFPLSVLKEYRKRHPEVRVILDGSQWLGHRPLMLDRSLCDILCAPGHKALFGLQGSGFAVFVTEGIYTPFAFGGSGNQSESEEMPAFLPERMEAGTLATPAIAALNAGTKYLLDIGMDTVEKRIGQLTEQIYARLDAIRGISVLSRDGHGIVSFNTDRAPSSVVASFLDTRGIAVRSGLHCAPRIHRALTEGKGAVRISVSYLNQIRDIDRLYLELKSFSKIFG